LLSHGKVMYVMWLTKEIRFVAFHEISVFLAQWNFHEFVMVNPWFAGHEKFHGKSMEFP